MEPQPSLNVVVVGAGPSGLMVADILSQSKIKVLLIDAMPSPGRKFLMAGRGGLNLTHSEDFQIFESRYQPDPQWMLRYLRVFTPDTTRRFMDELGAETFVGSSGRVFPKAMKATPLLRSWLERIKSQGVETSWGTRFLGFCDDHHIEVQKKDEKRKLGFTHLVLAMGGASWPRLGSDALWVSQLKNLGVDITPFEPSNMGVILNGYEGFLEQHKGQPIKALSLQYGQYNIKGEIMITKTGLEGGAIYALSSIIREDIKTKKCVVSLDLKPELSLEALKEKLDKYGPKTSFNNKIRKGAHLSSSALSLLNYARKYHPDMSPESLIKALPLSVKSVHGIDRAISSAGGVKTTELNTDLSLKIKHHIFCVGEMIDWEAPTGGYLLQGCFSTAHACASSIIRRQIQSSELK